jgi:Tyrosine phosphatase family
MAQQPLCRTGTHEEEQRSTETGGKQAGGKQPLWYSEILQRWVSNLPLEANGNLLKRRTPAGKVCPDRLKSLLPPSNFGAVIPGKVYRSSMPEPENFAFLSSLKLKTVLYAFFPAIKVGSC